MFPWQEPCIDSPGAVLVEIETPGSGFRYQVFGSGAESR